MRRWPCPRAAHVYSLPRRQPITLPSAMLLPSLCPLANYPRGKTRSHLHTAEEIRACAERRGVCGTARTVQRAVASPAKCQQRFRQLACIRLSEGNRWSAEGHPRPLHRLGFPMHPPLRRTATLLHVARSPVVAIAMLTVGVVVVVATPFNVAHFRCHAVAHASRLAVVAFGTREAGEREAFMRLRHAPLAIPACMLEVAKWGSVPCCAGARRWDFDSASPCVHALACEGGNRNWHLDHLSQRHAPVPFPRRPRVRYVTAVRHS